MSNNNIKKRLKQKFNYVKSLGYNILYLALKGSQNYNLALEDSAIDCIAIVIPSLDYMILGKELISKELHLENDEKITLIDIRKLPTMLSKQDTSILESLVTEFIMINKKYHNQVTNIINMVDDIVENCGINIYHSLIGMLSSCYNKRIIADKLEINGCESIKYDYNSKNVYQELRLYQLIYNIYNGLQYKVAINTYTDGMYETIMDIRKHKLSYEDVCMKSQICYDDINILYDRVKAKYNKDDNQQGKYYKLISGLVYNIVYSEIKDIIIGDSTLDNTYLNINLDRYKNIYFTADTHFGHTNIMKYTNRELGMNVTSIEEHDEQLINMWNSIVKDGDLVFILGDLCLYGPKKAEKLLRQLKGDKVLVKGNHDTFVESNNFNKTLFKYIDDYMEINYKGQKIMLMHYPINSFKHMCKEDHSYLHFFRTYT